MDNLWPLIREYASAREAAVYSSVVSHLEPEQVARIRAARAALVNALHMPEPPTFGRWEDPDDD